MRRFLLATRVASILLVLAPTLPAGPARAAGPTMDDALAAIAAYAPEAMRAQGTPGLSIAITDRNRTLRVITLGFANLETRTAVTPQTRFAIGSITKSMTGPWFASCGSPRRTARPFATPTMCSGCCDHCRTMHG